MQTVSFVHLVQQFSIDVASACRVFQLKQIARHPHLAKRTQPVKRASEALRGISDYFDKIPAPYGEPFRFRLSEKGKKALGIKQKALDLNTQKVYHWLALTDLWINLALYDQMGVKPEQPTIWKLEPKHSAGFDCFCVWRNHSYLFELQRTKINSTAWQKKWQYRKRWLENEDWKKASWQPKDRDPVLPEIILIAQPQQEETMQIPSFVTWIRDKNDVARRLYRKQNLANVVK